MLMGRSPRITVEELLTWGLRFCGLSFAALLVVFFLLFSFSGGKKKISLEMAIKATPKEFNYAAIGKGALSLSAARSSHFLPWLGNEVLLLARNTRPGAEQSEPSFLVGLKSTGEERVVKMGEPIFLSAVDKEKEGRKSVRLSTEPTALWIKPLSFSRSQTTFEVGRRLEDEKEEKGQLVLNVSTDPGRRALSLRQKNDAPFVRTIREAKHWSRDRLLETYGGEGYRRLREKEKIQFMQDDKSYVCFVSSGDFLIWQDGRWRPVAAAEVSRSEPICQVKTASPRAVEIEAWDETGFYHLAQKVEAQFGGGAHSGKDTPLFSSIRMRNNSEVTCVAGKRRVVIREGDWLLKTSSGWRNLRSVEQIEECITHQLMGELFICDGFETVQGKTHMKGHFFDSMRTQVQTLSFPIAAEKKSMKNKERRRRR